MASRVPGGRALGFAEARQMHRTPHVATPPPLPRCHYPSLHLAARAKNLALLEWAQAMTTSDVARPFLEKIQEYSPLLELMKKMQLLEGQMVLVFEPSDALSLLDGKRKNTVAQLKNHHQNFENELW